jgi:uncharacterized protein YjdB
MKRLIILLAMLLGVCSCEQKEQEVAVSSVSISQPSAEMVIGETLQLNVIISPSNATDKEVVWASSKQSVASVSQSGQVTAISEGSSSITATVSGKVGTCTVTVVKGFVAVSSIELNKKTLTMTEGDEFVLEAIVKPDDATDKSVTWSSSNSDVATVDNSGKVTAIKEGEAKITAKAGEKTAECPVVVEKRIIPVLAVVLSDESLDMVIGDEYKLNVTITPNDATDKTETWTSSAPTVASVKDGVVSALSEGVAVITVQVGDKKDACSVSVSKRKIPVTMVMLDHTTLDMIVGDETTLLATIVPEDATDKKIQWSTSNPSVATVQEGTVKAVKEGDAKIVAYVDGKTAECAVHVDYIPVQSITLDIESIVLYETETHTFNVTIKPDNATYQEITWESTDNEVATVTNGKLVALKRGNATVKATANGQSATCPVQVLTAIDRISLNKPEIQLIVGDIENLSVQFFPEEATPRGKTSWVSSNPSAATVDENGKVTAIKEGEAKIIATLDGKTAECAVHVDYIPVQSITLDMESIVLYETETYSFNVTVKPDNATYQDVTWESSDNEVVTVSRGKVVAVKRGNATVKASANGQSTTCAIKVLKAIESISIDKSTIQVIVGNTEPLKVQFFPEEATPRGSISWTSSDTNVATVDENGKVTAKKVGEAMVTASLDGKTAECKVIVYIPVTSISLNKTSITLRNGESYQLQATILPDNATFKDVKWESSDDEIVSVDTNGLVTTRGVGIVTITANAGDCSANCVVTALPAGGNEGTGEEIWK